MCVWQSQLAECTAANRRFRDGISLGTPKLNALVTESLCCHLINERLLVDSLPELDHAILARGTGNEPDVWVTGDRCAARRTLEVKATCPTTWQRASANDASADYFIWLNLGPLSLGSSDVHVWVLRSPARYLRANLDWRSERQFERLTSHEAICVKVPLVAVLGSSPSMLRAA